MRILGVAIDSPALVLPLVSGAAGVQPHWVQALVHQLAQALVEVGPGHKQIVVLGEAAHNGADLVPVDQRLLRDDEGDLNQYVREGFSQLYGALGLEPPQELRGTSALYPESLGHGVVRYLVGRAVSLSGLTPEQLSQISVARVVLSGPLAPSERHAVLELARSAHMTLVATHNPSGTIAAGMGRSRHRIQEEVDQLVAALGL